MYHCYLSLHLPKHGPRRDPLPTLPSLLRHSRSLVHESSRTLRPPQGRRERVSSFVCPSPSGSLTSTLVSRGLHHRHHDHGRLDRSTGPGVPVPRPSYFPTSPIGVTGTGAGTVLPWKSHRWDLYLGVSRVFSVVDVHPTLFEDPQSPVLRREGRIRSVVLSSPGTKRSSRTLRRLSSPVSFPVPLDPTASPTSTTQPLLVPLGPDRGVLETLTVSADILTDVAQTICVSPHPCPKPTPV